MPETSDRSAPAEAPRAVTTHISLLLLTGDRVLKFRKPIVTDFCDFATVESRLHDCEREVELNRRLTDDVYIGVGRVQLTEEPADHAEPCVVMRRLPDDRLLSTMIAAGEDIGDAVRSIARQLAVFHANATHVTATDLDDGLRKVEARWADAVEKLRPLAHGPEAAADLEEIEQLARRWCAGSTGLFRQRLADGFVRDGHGDLRAENIFCLDDGPRILDCIEFDDELRHIDVVTDLAFLVMDLRRLGRPAEAETLIEVYEEAADGPVPRALLEHDAAYWALVRAKVTHLRAAQGDPSARAEAVDLQSLALALLRQARVRLVVVGGLPGTGKSTLARHLAAATGWVVVSSDHVRKELAALPLTARSNDGYGEGLYAPDRVGAVYAEMLRRAQHCLERGQSVILDASWIRSADRVDAASLAHAAHAVLHEVRCTVDDEVARSRLVARVAGDTDASDADPAIAQQMAASLEPWPTAVTIDTSGAIEETTTRLRDLFDAPPAPMP
ncbi:MAG: AAA family ATPase [Aquihabitans sp.]